MSPLLAILIQIGLSLAQNAPAEIAAFASLVGMVKGLLSAPDQATLDTFLAAIASKLDADLAKGIADAQAGAAGQPMPAGA